MSRSVEGDAADAARAADASHSSPQAVSTKGGIPIAGMWAVLSGRWGYEAVQIHAVTPKLIKHKRGYGRRLSQSPRESIVALFDDGQAAGQLVQAIDGARDRFRKQRRAEFERHSAAIAAIDEKRDAAVQRVIDAALTKARGEQP